MFNAFLFILFYFKDGTAEMKRTTQTMTRRSKTACRVTKRKTNIDIVIIIVV